MASSGLSALYAVGGSGRYRNSLNVMHGEKSGAETQTHICPPSRWASASTSHDVKTYDLLRTFSFIILFAPPQKDHLH